MELSQARDERRPETEGRTVPSRESRIVRSYIDAPEKGTGVNAPASYALMQNYPNPFNPSTVIEFELAEASEVTLKIYNTLGQEVATLLDHAWMEDGSQSLEFNANNLPSGVYFYRIVAQGFGDEDAGIAGQST